MGEGVGEGGRGGWERGGGEGVGEGMGEGVGEGVGEGGRGGGRGAGRNQLCNILSIHPPVYIVQMAQVYKYLKLGYLECLHIKATGCDTQQVLCTYLLTSLPS